MSTYAMDDYALFVAVADAGSLASAAAVTGVSAPTLSRRMNALERRLALRLFERGPQGYVLTSAGRRLLEEAAPLRDAMARLGRFSEQTARPRVRITAGHWTSRFLAKHIARFWSPEADWVPEFLPSKAMVDIARREADIGIRRSRPDQTWLAGRATLPVTYREYGRGPEVRGYLTVPEGAPTAPTDRWIRRHHADAIVTCASDPRVMVDLAVEGVGRVVLPGFTGDALPGLRRLSEPIAEIGHDEWLVCHHDARHDRPVRAALDALTGLLCDRRLRPGEE